MRQRCGWYGDFAALLRSNPTSLASHLADAFATRGHQQFEAWASSLGVLCAAATACVAALPPAADFAAILEYQLPRDERRPDAILLENGTVVVIEFKESESPTRAAEDQVRAYARDLRCYHSSCHDRRVVPILVPLGYRGPAYERDGVTVSPADELAAQILDLTPRGPLRRPDAAAWLDGRYDPLPGIAHAARALFHREPLPRIRRADAAGIPEVHARLLELARSTAAQSGRTLVLLSGAPGAGKTLVGLQLVHSAEVDALVRGDRGRAGAAFLSGNDPLVDVLQTALKSRDFVQPLKGFLVEYVGHPDRAPPEHVIVFDEAQRAWDERKVRHKHRGALGEDSEPELLLRVAERVPGWSLVVALLGEGQEIHRGEEGGLALWSEALRTRGQWQVVAPPGLAAPFFAEGARVTVDARLHLDTTLRAHDVGALHRWVGALLASDLASASAIAPELGGFDLYVTRDLDAARRYVRERYGGRSDRRWGLLASSCAENLRGELRRLKEDGVGASYGRWYEGTPRGANFCCSLETAVSEFGCQGLELDYAVVCWGDDLSWSERRWAQQGGKKRLGVKDYQRLRLNAYRVLLTRGRDGMCIYVPRSPDLDGVEDALRAAGVAPLTLARR